MPDAPRPLPAEAARKHGSGSPDRLGAAYFDQPCVSLAKALLGQILVRKLPDGRELRGRIVETEAYLGGEDTASHSRGGRRTARNAAMFMRPGTLYVYQIYGIYFCMNVSSQGEGAAVLLRSLEPLQGLEAMQELRLARQQKAPARPLKDWQLCNGPSKLCQALAIDRRFDQQDLGCNSSIWLEPGLEASRDRVPVCAPRVGISGEWAQMPLRFYLHGNKCVSLTKMLRGNRHTAPSERNLFSLQHEAGMNTDASRFIYVNKHVLFSSNDWGQWSQMHSVPHSATKCVAPGLLCSNNPFLLNLKCPRLTLGQSQGS